MTNYILIKYNTRETMIIDTNWKVPQGKTSIDALTAQNNIRDRP